MFDGYIICSTPRSGSTLLCNLLASTRSAGEPDSFYRRQIIAWWASKWHLPAPDTVNNDAFERAYLEAAVKAGKAETPIFGMRLMRENLEELSEILDRRFPQIRSDRARFETAFGKLLYIHLSREDKLAQAISLVKAEQTGLWHIAPDGTEIERLAPAAAPHYAFERIKTELGELNAYDAAWVSWFQQQEIAPLTLTYERLSADPAGALIGLCKALGVHAPKARDVTPGLARLADEISLDWKQRYLADLSVPL